MADLCPLALEGLNKPGRPTLWPRADIDAILLVEPVDVSDGDASSVIQ